MIADKLTVLSRKSLQKRTEWLAGKILAILTPQPLNSSLEYG
jgi:hypothetical protein